MEVIGPTHCEVFFCAIVYIRAKELFRPCQGRVYFKFGIVRHI